MLALWQAWLLLVLFFLIGIGMHVLLRAGYAYRSAVNPYPTRRAFVRKHWDTILVRTFLNSWLFWLWVSHPDLVSRIASALGVSAAIADWLTVPVSLGTAVMFGFFVDVFLDSVQSIVAKIPQLAWLNKYLR